MSREEKKIAALMAQFERLEEKNRQATNPAPKEQKDVKPRSPVPTPRRETHDETYNPPSETKPTPKYVSYNIAMWWFYDCGLCPVNSIGSPSANYSWRVLIC